MKVEQGQRTNEHQIRHERALPKAPEHEVGGKERDQRICGLDRDVQGRAPIGKRGRGDEKREQADETGSAGRRDHGETGAPAHDIEVGNRRPPP